MEKKPTNKDFALVEAMISPNNEKYPKLRVFLDGEEYHPGVMTITSQYGTLGVGKRPEGFNGWLFRDPGGGGSVTIPWAEIPSGEILVGLVHEDRPNLGHEKVWCAIGGMLDPAETHKEANIREANEEAGLNVKNAVALAGKPVVQDRLFYIVNIEEGEGIRLYTLEVAFKALEETDLGWRMRTNLLNDKRESEMRFFPWREAARISPDSLAHSGIVRLLAFLRPSLL